ncbi:MAG: hypothetical protein JJU28_23660 [Cyclobacteriaceae bacterium]|nr:hypothetical protein [Cyclobacteriaceae bacterium]
MKKAFIYSISAFIFAFLAVNISLFASDYKALLGSWSYEAPQTPYPEYSKGQLILSEKEGKLHGQMKIGENARDLLNVKFENNVLSFGTYLEGEYISIKLNVKDTSFIGSASYTDGSVELKGKKDK